MQAEKFSLKGTTGMTSPNFTGRFSSGRYEADFITHALLSRMGMTEYLMTPTEIKNKKGSVWYMVVVID